MLGVVEATKSLVHMQTITASSQHENEQDLDLGIETRDILG